ncbi:MAG: GNAT family protein [Patescibacteria group bacterium]
MVIKTKQFTIRPFKMSDAKDIVKNINNKKVSQYLSTVPYPYGIKDAKTYLNKVITQYKVKEPATYACGIEINGEICGSIGLHRIKIGHKAELGYWLAEKHWGKGIMSKAVSLFVAQGFKKFKLIRIYAYVFAQNKGSKIVLENNGFKLEGYLKKHVKSNNKIYDAYLFAKVK